MTKTKLCKVSFFGRVTVGSILLFMLSLPLVTYSASVTVQWEPPTTNTDGSVLLNLAYYRLYYGFSSRNYTFHMETNKPAAYVDGLIANSNYYFAVVAVNSNNMESRYSNESMWNRVVTLEILTSTNAVTVPEGSTASFQVKLNTAPVSPTTVTVSRLSGDTDVTVQSGTSLVFNASSWNTNQTVILSAAEDTDTANYSAVIRCSVMGIVNADVVATEQDNDPTTNLAVIVDNADAMGVEIVGTWTDSTSTPEYWRTNYVHDGNTGKGTKSVIFRPNLPSAGDYEVSIWYSELSNRATNVPVDIVYGGGSKTMLVNQRVNGSQWVVLGTNGFAAGTNNYVRVRNDGTTDYVITDAVRFKYVGQPALEILTSTNAVTVPEGGTASFRVKLNTAPISPTTVTVSRLSGDAGIAVQSGASLVFNASTWSSYQIVTLLAAADLDRLNDTAVIRCSVAGVMNTDVTATEQDNTPALQILTSTNAVTVPEGSTASFLVNLNTAPVSPTTVTVNQVSGDTDLTVQSGASLVFNASTWSSYQIVTLSAAADLDRLNDTAVIRCSVAGVTNTDVTATEQDNTPALQILTSTNAVTVPEGSTASFLVNLNTAPVSPMTVTVSRLRGDTDVTVQAGTSLVFNASTWSSYQIVTLSAAADLDRLNDTAVIRCSVAGVTNTDVTATEQDNTPALQILTSTNAVTVPEGSTASFLVNLNTAPVSPTTVTVSQVSGDTDLTVQSGASLIFDATSWSTYQTVTLSATKDADAINGSATIQCSAPGTADADVTVTEQDNDATSTNSEVIVDNKDATGVEIVGAWTDSTSTPGYWRTNYVHDGNTGKGTKSVTFRPNLPSAGDYEVSIWYSELSNRATNVPVDIVYGGGSKTVLVNQRVNGSQWVVLGTNGFAAGTNGYVRVRNDETTDYVIADAVKFKYVGQPALEILTSTNAVTVPEGGTASFQVKLNTAPISPTTVTVSRLSGDAGIAVQSGASLVFNASTWSNNQIVKLSAAEDADTVNSSAVIRCSAVGITGKDVTATEEDNDKVVNFALASRGSTITGNNGANWSKLIDGVTTGYTGSAGYGYTYYKGSSNTPGAMTLDLKSLYPITRVKLLLWDLDSRYYRYKIEASSNNTTWTTIVDRTATTNRCRSWQDISFDSAIQARYLRLVGTYNSANSQFHAVEWEVYGTVEVGGETAMGGEAMTVARSSSALSSEGSVSVLEPMDVRTSDPEPDTNGWKAVDGNLGTFWQGQANAGGWWLVLAYGKDVKAQDIQVQWGEGSATNLLLFGSADAEQWYDLAPLLKQGPVSFEYLWFVFPDGELGIAPKVSEIKVNLAK